MLSMYTSYKCIACRFEFVLLTEEVAKMSMDRYLVCPYCNSKKVIIENTNDSLKKCMGHDTYKRINGAVRQVRNE